MVLKKIALAAALATAGSPALAFLSTPSTGNGELVFVLVDRTDQVSYLLDLGLSLDAGVAGATQFDGNATYSYSLGGANFQAFLSAAAAQPGTLEFAVFGGDNTGTGAGSRRMFSTVNAVDTPLSNGLQTNANANMTTFMGFNISEATGATHSTVDNGDGWASVGNNAYFLQVPMDSFNNVTASQGWLNTNAVGTKATFRGFSTSLTSATSNGTPTQKVDFAGTWSVDNAGGVYTLSYGGGTVPIPEADGILMLMAGLGAMAFVGRRRRNA
jgi:hypothetical protein